MLTNQAWQPLPGTRHAEIYPYIRKPDLLSSNSCLIRTPEQIILIDAGALPAQTADLERILSECHRKCPRPVLLFLTHGHIDHSLRAGNLRRTLTAVQIRIAVQAEGAAFLAEGDSQRTMADLYGAAFPPLHADILLLAGQDRKSGTQRCIDLAPGAELTLRTEAVPTDLGRPLIRQVISLGGGDELEIFPTPGHSPDSICIRIGEILFTGDLLAAANPMVAGISGWNRDNYRNSLQDVSWFLDHQPVRFCFPGHGGILPADKTRAIIQRLLHKTGRMSGVTEMNGERLFQITEYALELIDEAEEVFTSIAGRLLYVSYQLEQLEEGDAAERCRTAMPMEQIDACLLDFRNLCLALDAKKILRVEFAFGVLRIVEKIKSLFDPRPLSVILPHVMINRGTGLLLDFIGIANGYRNLEEFIPADLNALIDDAVDIWRSNPRLDPSIIDYADDHEKYLAALICRIGYGPEASRAAIRFTPLESLPLAHIAAARFSNTLLNFLEWLDRTGPSSVHIATDLDRAVPFLTIVPRRGRDSSPASYEKKKMDSFTRRFRMCGLLLETENEGFRLTVIEENGEEARDTGIGNGASSGG